MDCDERNHWSTLLFASSIRSSFLWQKICDLKWILRTPTVTKIDKVISNMLKRRYLLSKGTARDVGGMISASSRKNTVRDRRTEIHRVTCIRA